MKQFSSFLLILVLVVAAILVLVLVGRDSMSHDVLIVSIINIVLVGTTSVYVILTWKLVVTSQKQLVHAHKPILMISFSTYEIGYVGDNGERNIAFEFRITNCGPHIAVRPRSRLLAKVNGQSLVTESSIIKGEANLLFLFPPGNESDNYLDISYQCIIPRDFLKKNKPHFDLECIVEYTSSIGTEHSSHCYTAFDLELTDTRSMLVRNLNFTQRVEFK